MNRIALSLAAAVACLSGRALAANLSDGNANLGLLGTGFSQSVFGAPLGDGTLTTSAGSPDQLYKYCWYYQVGSGSNCLMSLLDNPTQTFNGNTATIVYNNAGPGVAGQHRFDATFVLKLTAGPSSDQVNVACNVTFTNHANQTNIWRLFNLVDLDVAGSPTDDTGTVDSTSSMSFTDPLGSYAKFIGPGATRAEVNSGFALRGKLNGSTSELSTSTTPYFGDAAGAYQWTLTLAPGESRLIQTAFSINRAATLLPAADSVWAADNSGSWSSAGNWNGGIPDGVDAGASFGGVITAARTVTLDTSRVVGHITFDNPATYSISGSSTLSLQVSSGSATLSVLNGSHEINTPLKLASNSVIQTAGAASQLSLLGDMTSNAGVSLTKEGAGTVNARHVRVDSLIINSGKLKVNSQPAPTSSAGTSKTKSLTVASGSQLDLSNNAMVIDYDGATPHADVLSLLQIGRAGGAWNGNGIASSTAASNSRTSIGMVEASDIGPGTFKGQSTDSTSLLLAYALNGDTNLDGMVDSIDFSRFMSGYGTATPLAWAQGDFDYSGKVNTIDFNLLATNFGQPIPASPVLGAVVPEPFTAACLPALTLLLRRRKM